MLDKKLDLENKKYDAIKAPDYMEERLKESLDGIRSKKRGNILKIASFILVFGLILAMNSNTIAGLLSDSWIDEKIMKEYSEILPEKIMDYKDEGLIQNVSKILELDGKEILIDGIIVDSLGVNIFIDSEKGAYNSIRLIDGEKKGEYRELLSRGTGIEGVEEEKWHYYFRGDLKNNKITLDFTNEKNMSKSLEIGIDEEIRIDDFEKIRINKKVKVGDLNYNIKNIYITPVRILLEGYNENILELGYRTVFKRRKNYEDIGIDLIINGQRISASESSRKTDMSGISFDYLYNDFPKDIKSLEIELIDLKNMEIIEKIDVIGVK